VSGAGDGYRATTVRDEICVLDEDDHVIAERAGRC
jgi:hypothetical protein